MHNSDDLFERREQHKFALDSYFMYWQNHLDYEVDILIEKLKDQRDGHYSHYYDFEKMRKEEPKRFMELADRNGMSPEELEAQANGSAMDAVYVEDELNAFAEIQIIYAYKHLEIHIKRLLEIGYGNLRSKQFFQWNALHEFLKQKLIDLGSLEGYKEIDQLRRVNNTVKHSDGPAGKELDDIEELKGKDYLDTESLRTFYARVKNVPMKFLSVLGGAIYTQLYTYDETRIENISKDLAEKMDKDAAGKLIDSLKKYYDY